MKWIKAEFELIVKLFWPPGLFFIYFLIFNYLGGFDIFPIGFDNVFHFFGGTVMAISAYWILVFWQDRKLLGKVRPWMMVFFIIVLTTFTAVMWEFAEFIVDQLFAASHQAGVLDTMDDLAYGIIGSIITACLVWIFKLRK